MRSLDRDLILPTNENGIKTKLKSSDTRAYFTTAPKLYGSYLFYLENFDQ